MDIKIYKQRLKQFLEGKTHFSSPCEVVYVLRTIRIILEHTPKIERKGHWKTMKDYCNSIMHSPIDRGWNGSFLRSLSKIENPLKYVRWPHWLGRISAEIQGRHSMKQFRNHHRLLELPGFKESLCHYCELWDINVFQNDDFWSSFKDEYKKEMIGCRIKVHGAPEFEIVIDDENMHGCITVDKNGNETKAYFFKPQKQIDK